MAKAKDKLKKLKNITPTVTVSDFNSYDVEKFSKQIYIARITKGQVRVNMSECYKEAKEKLKVLDRLLS
jgi:hypothetical protein